MLNLKGFKPISVFGCASASTMTITNKYFKFNGDTAKELGSPKFGKILVNDQEKKVAIVGCEETDDSAVAISCDKNESGRRYVINFQHKTAHALIRKLMGWDDNLSRKIPGVLVPDSNAIIYDLQQAKTVGKGANE